MYSKYLFVLSIVFFDFYTKRIKIKAHVLGTDEILIKFK